MNFVVRSWIKVIDFLDDLGHPKKSFEAVHRSNILGLLIDYKDRPEIIVQDPDQLKFQLIEPLISRLNVKVIKSSFRQLSSAMSKLTVSWFQWKKNYVFKPNEEGSYRVMGSSSEQVGIGLLKKIAEKL